MASDASRRKDARITDHWFFSGVTPFDSNVSACGINQAGLLKMDAEGLATRGDALLQRGFEPTPAQWTRIKSKLKRGRTEFSPHALRAWLSEAGSIQIPWSLPWVCEWKDPQLVQDWLAKQGHPALRNLLVSTGMLASTPADQWLDLLKPLYQAESRRLKKEQGLGQQISA